MDYELPEALAHMREFDCCWNGLRDGVRLAVVWLRYGGQDDG